MSFVDEVRLRVRAGQGGAGAVSFARTAPRSRGAPDGGDGGRGGSVVLVADPALGSLAPYVRRRHVRAGGGGRGGPNTRRGRDGSDAVLAVPVGTVVRRSGEVVADLARPGFRYVVARGGRGGRGNAALRSPRDRLPNYAEPGEPGEEAELVLELHLVADVGLVGPPNAGKSTLLASLTRARPRVADYPFTTVDPNLGVLEEGGDTYVVADLPGLIAGAAQGRGLGLRFLRHAERCLALVLVVDLSRVEVAGDLEAVCRELAAYDEEAPERVALVVGTKIDLPTPGAKEARRWARARGAGFVACSALRGTNLARVRRELALAVEQARQRRGGREVFAVFRPVGADRVVVEREDSAFRVRSLRAERAVARTPLDNPRAVRRLQRHLAALGVERALRREGAVAGDEVRIGPASFEWVPEDEDA